jgi:uncharacterized FlaG/YvyC family protein
MSTPLSLQPIAHAHQDDATGNLASSKPKQPSAPELASEPVYASSTVALSFAFDIVTKSLNVVMTDKTSGEVVRKIAFTHIPSDIHQSDKLHGLLLDQFA